MDLTEKTLDKKEIYKGKIFDVDVDTVSLPNGITATREYVKHPGGVCVVPLTDQGEVVLVEQYRYPYFKTITEIPAGKREYGEADPLECGKRELKEEVGATAKNWHYLGELYPTPAYVDEVIHIYLATGLTFTNQQLDPDEFLNIKHYPLEKAVEMVLMGEIADSKTQVGILKTYMLTNRQNKD